MKKPELLTLKKRAINSGLWVSVSYGAQQVLRFGSNLILTRLLFPEAFGLMAIMQAVMIGLTMMSDIGIQPSIVQNKRGNEASFLNTAWTIQVIQGLVIFLIVLVTAPFFAEFYHEPLLLQLLPVVGLGAVIAGFNSTKLATANRELYMAKVTMIEIVTYVISLITIILFAWLYKSVWALVWGTLLGGLLKMLASHYMLPGNRNHFAWEQASVKALFGFGSWIFVSSALTFLAGEGNKLFVAKLLDVNMLAFYTLASTMSLIFWQSILQLSGKILLPAYSEVLRNNPYRIHNVMTKTRLVMIIPSWICALFFVFYGDQFMWLLYDDRYRESGVMLRILAMGSLAGIVGGSYAGILLAKGLVRSSTALLALQIVVQVIAILIGHHFYQEYGVVIALASVSWLMYPAYTYVHIKAGLWQPKIDLPILALSSIIIFFASMSLKYV
ncbi:MAG: oligosaccharide flippase family protein [Methylotenera sp.]|nr:oligosaccharide flippase family protein [Methylotenera sp.]